MRYLLLIIGILLFPQNIFSQKHWESIVLATDTFRYYPATHEPASGWNQPGFDDHSWNKNVGGFGYGDGDDATTITSSNSLYLRKEFNIADISLISNLLLDIDYDDAYVFYLNGKEVSRSSNITANPPLYNSSLSADHEALLYQNLTPERMVLDVQDLVQGENTLAVQILNNGINSSDMSALVFLNAQIESSTTVYHEVPSWFSAPIVYENFDLPLFVINTINGQNVPDDPKVTANMKIINNPTGINNLSDTVYEYNGYIGIEIRGSSSLSFDKKGYGVETRDETGANFDVELLGLPAENDWVLHGPYSDKSLIRNALAYYLGNQTGHWSPRTRFCELYLNKDYRGVYVLVEKIKQNKERVNIAKLKPEDISGDDLTGGYILKIDRPDPGYWVSPYKSQDGLYNIYFSYVDPKYEDLTVQQRQYIKKYVTDFENALFGNNYKDEENGYRSFINTESFADYYLINELSRNVDAYRLSTYFHKDKDSKGGKLTMGPLWDYNLAFGNCNYCSGNNTSGWVIDGIGEDYDMQVPEWWDRLRSDPYFETQLKTRWELLRTNVFSLENINNFIDSCTEVLANSEVRNFQRFDILSIYIWPNAYWGGTYSNEINYLKSWINKRLQWMDSKIRLITDVDAPTVSTHSFEVIEFPNPFVSSVTLRFNLSSPAKVEVLMQDVMGRNLFIRSKECEAGENEFTFNSSDFGNVPNLYIYKLLVNNSPVYSGKIIKQ